MIKIGTLKDYRKAQKMLKEAGIEFTKTEGDLVKKTMLKDEELVSVARIRSNRWVFKYNPLYFQETGG